MLRLRLRPPPRLCASVVAGLGAFFSWVSSCVAGCIRGSSTALGVVFAFLCAVSEVSPPDATSTRQRARITARDACPLVEGIAAAARAAVSSERVRASEDEARQEAPRRSHCGAPFASAPSAYSWLDGAAIDDGFGPGELRSPLSGTRERARLMVFLN